MPKEKKEGYEKEVSLACVNFKTAWGDKPTNLKRMGQFICQAAELGSNIIVFPELALTGYECQGKDCPMHAETAETIPGPSTEEMARLAAKHDVYVVFGIPEKDVLNPEIRYISSALVGPSGLLGKYRKFHIGGPPRFEEKCFTGGDQLPVFETRYGPVGIQICVDFWIYPELSRILTLKGARIILNTSASTVGPGKPYFFVQQTGARATENRIFTASANLVGKEQHFSYFGHSTIAGPEPPRSIKIYTEGGEGEEIVMARLDLEALCTWREQSAWEKERRGDIILAELEKIEPSRLAVPG